MVRVAFKRGKYFYYFFGLLLARRQQLCPRAVRIQRRQEDADKEDGGLGGGQALRQHEGEQPHRKEHCAHRELPEK